MKYLLLLPYFLSFCSPLSAQIPGMRKYTQLDGYRATTGYALWQDKKGYLWIGSDNGGIRFDGQTFKELQTIHHSINPEIIECIPLEPELIACIPVTGDIYILDHDSVKAAVSNRNVTVHTNATSYEPQTNTFWLWDSWKKDILYKVKGTEWKRFPIKADDFDLGQIVGNTVVGTEKRRHFIGMYNILTGRIRPFYHIDGSILSTSKESLLVPRLSCSQIMTYEAQGRFLHVYDWIPGDSVLREINRLVFPMTFWFSPLHISRSITGRSYFFYRKPDKYLVYCPDLMDKNAAQNLLDIYVPGVLKSFFVDRNDNAWITSAENALYFISGKHINNALMVARVALSTTIPKSISGIRDQLCISYPNSNMLTYISAQGARHFELKDAFGQGPRCMKVLEDSNIYFYEGDIGMFNTRKQTISYLYVKKRSIKDVCLYQNGVLAATHEDAIFLRKNKHRYRYRSIFEGRSTAIQATPSGQILIGTPLGLYRKDGLAAPAIYVDDPVLKQQYVTSILLYSDSHALVSTNNGLFLYSLNGSVRKLEAPDVHTPIPAHIRQMYRQDSATFWAATDEGACVLAFGRNGQLESVKNYTFYDGLPSNNVTSIYTRRDTAYVATADGLGIIPLQDTTILHMPAPHLYIDRMQVGQRSISAPGAKIGLPNDSNELRIVLSAISYESVGNIQYYYRLSPIQEAWVNTEEPEARFPGLAPGSYVFEAFAVNAKNVKSTVVRLELFVPPAYWQTIYFKIGLVLLAATCLFVLIRWQLKRSEKKRYLILQQKKHMAELELEAIKAQINPHFISNCLNSIQYLNYTEDYQGAQLYLGRFARLIRLTLQYSSKVFITVEEEIAYLSEYLQMEKLRLKDRLQCSMENDLEQGTLIPAMLLQPYVENALKYGLPDLPAVGKISIRFRKEGEHIEITISDDGSGFSDKQSVASMGLRLSSTRALSYNELFNMEVTIQCYNKQELQPEHTGAVVCILIKPDKNGKTNYTVRHHR